jgi:lipoyl(octanoyl) transferase
MEWRVDKSPVDYLEAVADMEARADAIRAGTADERVWLLEHPPIYTAGTSAKAGDLLTPDRFPVYETGRGGQYTYHGPGQRIAYVQLDLNKRGPDVRGHVCRLENWVIQTLSDFGIKGERRDGRIGVWVRRAGAIFPVDDKIAAMGVRVRRWVTLHGMALNVRPDISHYAGIVPCGVTDHGVTTMKALGVDVSLEEVDSALRRRFNGVFGAAEGELMDADD